MKALILSFLSDHWRKFLFPTAAIAVILALLLIPRGQADNGSIVISEHSPFPDLIEEDHEEVVNLDAPPSIIIIDVKGAVRHPGVYTMQEGDRLIDVINAAGGYVSDADSRMVNHALKLSDELLIYIPFEGEEILESETNSLISQSSPVDDGKININTADENELMTISGIGPAKASAIINYREEHGPFDTLESIMNISGIGQKTFEKFKDQIKVQ